VTRSGLMVLPILTGGGRQLTPEVATGTSLLLADVRRWPGGVVELTYDVTPT